MSVEPAGRSNGGAAAKIYRAEEFGSKADGRTDDTEALQLAIDTCAGRGGGRVVLSAGVYRAGTLELKTGVDFHIAAGATIKAIDDLARYPRIPNMLRDGVSDRVVEELKGYALLYAYRARNVRLSGEGTIDGLGDWFAGKDARPFALRIIESDEVDIGGLTLQQSAAWCCHVQLSRHVRIHDVTIRSAGVRNGDGIDIDSSSDVIITGCDIATADDAICLKTSSQVPCTNITVTDCTLESGCSGVKFGTESVGDFSNVRVSRCTLLRCGAIALKVTAVDGGSVANVEFSDLTIRESTGPIFIAVGNRGRRYIDAADPGRRSGIRDIAFRRMEITTARYVRRYRDTDVSDWGQGIVVSGRPDSPIRDITFEEVHTAFWGGVDHWDGDGVQVPFLTDEYPECYALGLLPSYGYYFQYAERIAVLGCSERLLNPDVRGLCSGAWRSHRAPLPGVCLADEANIHPRRLGGRRDSRR